jgi:hypothetical protein
MGTWWCCGVERDESKKCSCGEKCESDLEVNEIKPYKKIIYVEYYSHEKEDCYKIDLPWGDYKIHTKVLCKKSKGYEFAKTLAVGVVVQHLMEKL